MGCPPEKPRLRVTSLPTLPRIVKKPRNQHAPRAKQIPEKDSEIPEDIAEYSFPNFQVCWQWTKFHKCLIDKEDGVFRVDKDGIPILMGGGIAAFSGCGETRASSPIRVNKKTNSSILENLFFNFSKKANNILRYLNTCICLSSRHNASMKTQT